MTRGILDIEGTRLWVDTGILRMVLLSILIFGGAGMLMTVDVPLALIALSFVLVNLLVDLTYAWFDPRIRYR